MRWLVRPSGPSHRVKRCFAWLPVHIGEEWVWLERYSEIFQRRWSESGWYWLGYVNGEWLGHGPVPERLQHILQNPD